jgi:electron transfer flavoprotein alpha subunit
MILVYADTEQLMFELLGKARMLADELNLPVTALLAGEDTTAEDPISHGADRVLIAENMPTPFKAEEYADMLVNVITQHKPSVVLVGGDKNGQELASRTAAQMGAGCVTDCINVFVDGSTILAEKVVYGGNAVAVHRFGTEPAIVAIAPGTCDVLPAEKRTGDIMREKIAFNEHASKIEKIEKKSAESVNVEAAHIIVSCGRGLKKKEDIQQIEELAKVLKGATLGCSRPIAADLKWLSEDHWIGLSGHRVNPKLYIALGISGQIQHIAGMRDSSFVFAVNKDADAPIFKMADYGIVGDIYEVLPALITKFKEKIA